MKDNKNQWMTRIKGDREKMKENMKKWTNGDEESKKENENK